MRKRRGMSIREESVTTERAQQHRNRERLRGRGPPHGVSALSAGQELMR